MYTGSQVNHVKEAVAMENLVQFQTRCEELADESVDTIFTDQVVYGIVNRYCCRLDSRFQSLPCFLPLRSITSHTHLSGILILMCLLE